MQSLRFFIILVISLLGISAISVKAANFVSHDCPNTTIFTSNSTFHSNLNTLLSSLSSNASLGNNNGFFNASAGQDPDVVYGLFLCRADVTTDVCVECVIDASEVIVQRCPVQKVAIVWYDECLLRYSDEYIFSTMTTNPITILLNTVTESSTQLVRTAMREAAAQAAAAPSGDKKVAVREVNLTAFQPIYNFVQCTPDLSGYDCGRCLEEIIVRLPTEQRGGQCLTPSCIARFEFSPFYNETALPAAPEPEGKEPEGESGVSAGIIVAIVAASSAVAVALVFMGYCLLRRRSAKKNNTFMKDDVGNEITTVESLQFDFATIEAATQKFSNANKLGEGGFGVVYKGILPNGQTIAVKRLSASSGQGVKEFKNEVALVAKLQHRNLVRLFGFCVERGEKILIYEFVPNKSLDYFLFDLEKQALLHWSKRYKIIEGIARGILYLHQDSQLRIIHRDLKASNILLDRDMNSKISDFGMARIFGVEQTQGSTNRIVGTYGYMAPEYVMHGHFSVKSDAYSFGVLVLEIISGKKNSSFYQTDFAKDLASYVWKHWREGTPMEVLDPTVVGAYSRDEVIRCIHIGLLCVQEDPADRPTMATVVLMLNSYSISLPAPKEPAFFIHSKGGEHSLQMRELEPDQSTDEIVPLSVNEASITEMYPR